MQIDRKKGRRYKVRGWKYASEGGKYYLKLSNELTGREKEKIKT